MKYYAIVGQTASGKSTVEKNLRLRWSGDISGGNFQRINNILFCGRVLSSRDLFLRFGGSEATNYNWDYVINPEKYVSDYFDTIIFEKYTIPFHLLDTLSKKGDFTIFHFEVDNSISEMRLKSLNHPNPSRDSNPFYASGTKRFMNKRDLFASERGVSVVYISGDARDKCMFIEKQLNVMPLYDYIIYDFYKSEPQSKSDIVSRFLSGGDSIRSVNEVFKD